jgi:TolA-binding protein
MTAGNQVADRWNNRPNWDDGISRPDWGINDNWHDRWHDNCIHDHHDWYNGCWHGYWGSSWYAPVYWGAVGWGLGAWTSSWGYGTGYYNPYYAETTVAQSMPYDYSQPVVVNNYTSTNAEGGDATGGEAEASESSPVSQAGLKAFDNGLAKFKSGDYSGALTEFNSALKEIPGDPVVHEVRALTLFAIGEYSEAAASLNSLLSSAPGMDWTTMSGLYGNADDYTEQLRKLEQFCSSNPDDAAAHFVLAYHDLVTDKKDDAIAALRVVVKNQPKDVTAKRMLDALAPADTSTAQGAPQTDAAADGANPPETDLVGSWKATAGETVITLAIKENSEFSWTAKSPGKNYVTLTGTVSASSDGLALQTSDQGTMAGTVQSEGPDAWVFSISGAPPSDPGLSFARMN